MYGGAFDHMLGDKTNFLWPENIGKMIIKLIEEKKIFFSKNFFEKFLVENWPKIGQNRPKTAKIAILSTTVNLSAVVRSCTVVY